ncbi:MAG: hypothetical protein KJ659_03720 [Actinobacteria bacterium]|nr:hypothetical protein [Actinomycetota bacterium]MBU1609945.1 hypothetical protein [Actinomycetota bacterium]MBU2315287.1 hypothetical protein [Actinomycetota bacterium]MBU2384596.1 hypothetical protein [Actinomycetota bacterium]
MFGIEPGSVNEASGQDLESADEITSAELPFSTVLVVNVHLELLQHYTPVGKDWDHSNNDIDAAQTCLKIDDFEAAHSEPVSRGVRSGLQ